MDERTFQVIEAHKKRRAELVPEIVTHLQAIESERIDEIDRFIDGDFVFDTQGLGVIRIKADMIVLRLDQVITRENGKVVKTSYAEPPLLIVDNTSFANRTTSVALTFRANDFPTVNAEFTKSKALVVFEGDAEINIRLRIIENGIEQAFVVVYQDGVVSYQVNGIELADSISNLAVGFRNKAYPIISARTETGKPLINAPDIHEKK